MRVGTRSNSFLNLSQNYITIFGRLFKRKLSHSNSTSQSLYKPMISTLEKVRDIRNRSQRDLYVQDLCKREKNPRIAKTLEILFGEEATTKRCRNLHATTSSKLEETSEDPKETKSLFFLSFIIFIHFYPCMHITCINKFL